MTYLPTYLPIPVTRTARGLLSDPVDEAGMQRLSKASAKMVGDHRVGPMLPETYRLLHHFFRPFIARLADLLGDPRFLWTDL